jgi:glycosyltransferase involved in cell wall biosynthesis
MSSRGFLRAEEVTAGVATAAPQVEIVVPVHNEERVLAHSIHRLHEYLASGFPFSWRIVIVDNASTDGTLTIARRLAGELPFVDLIHVPVKGRGRALRAAWGASEADVVCYMDVDLSTDLRALLPLVAPLISGHSDVAIGSRLAHGANVTRGPKRELISRVYNRLLHTTLRAHFSDAQCGFKAIRADAVRELLPEIRDGGWFFDTELLVLAQRRGLRIHEVPVDWVEDADSRVEIIRTAVDDLRGIARLVASTSVARFMAVGVASTVAYALLFLLLRGFLPGQMANLLALAVTAVANTAANRRLTFGVRGSDGLARQHAAGFLVFVLSVALTSGTLAVLNGLAPGASRWEEAVLLAITSAGATVARYMALRTVVFSSISRTREVNGERRASARRIHGRDASSVGRDDRRDDRESKTGAAPPSPAARIRPPEALEELGGVSDG